MALCPGLPRWAGTRKVKPIWILLKQETESGSGISWAVCKSVPRSRQPASHHSSFLPCLPPNQQTVSKHWRQQSCVKQSTVNRLQQSVTSLTATRTHKPCDRITVLPATQQRRHSRLYPGKADTPFSDTGGKQGWIDVLGWLHTEMVYPPKDGHPSQY